MEVKENDPVDLRYTKQKNEPSISNREKEILTYVAKGLTNKQIAKLLILSPSTVRNHISRIFAKFKIQRRAQATAIAIYSGLLKEDINESY